MISTDDVGLEDQLDIYHEILVTEIEQFIKKEEITLTFSNAVAIAVFIQH